MTFLDYFMKGLLVFVLIVSLVVSAAMESWGVYALSHTITPYLLIGGIPTIFKVVFAFYKRYAAMWLMVATTVVVAAQNPITVWLEAQQGEVCTAELGHYNAMQKTLDSRQKEVNVAQRARNTKTVTGADGEAPSANMLILERTNQTLKETRLIESRDTAESNVSKAYEAYKTCLAKGIPTLRASALYFFLIFIVQLVEGLAWPLVFKRRNVSKITLEAPVAAESPSTSMVIPETEKTPPIVEKTPIESIFDKADELLDFFDENYTDVPKTAENKVSDDPFDLKVYVNKAGETVEKFYPLDSIENIALLEGVKPIVVRILVKRWMDRGQAKYIGTIPYIYIGDSTEEGIESQ